MNVFTLNSPAGHSAWYVGRTHACVRVCAFICGSKGDVAMTPLGVRGNVGHCDEDAYFSSTRRNCPGNVILKSYDVLCFTYMSSSASCTQAYIHMAITSIYHPCCRLEDLCLKVEWLPDLTLSL